MVTTEAWVLHEGSQAEAASDGRKGERGQSASQPGGLVLEEFSFSDVGPREVLIEPIYGSWEGNMAHALDRSPIDVCRARGEARVVLGNAGVVRVVGVGSAVGEVGVGDVCLFFSGSHFDDYGYMVKAHAYDGPNTTGLLARRSKASVDSLFKLPQKSRFSLRQWAAFSLRYMTAWSNWRIALGCLRLQLTRTDLETPDVWGWGGGVTLAELDLARRHGCRVLMISGSDHHIAEISRYNIPTLDRRELGLRDFDERSYKLDQAYRDSYMAGEKRFLERVRSITGRGVSIFIDYIGSSTHRLTMKALAREGVLATAGWKQGMSIPTNRALECIARHIHVFTHYARRDEAPAAIAYAEENGWIPNDDMPVYAWTDVPRLVIDFRNNVIPSYFPLFEVGTPPKGWGT